VNQPQFPDYLPTAAEVLRVGAERYADDPCVLTPTERMTFAELDDRSARLADGLIRQGVGKGSRVGLLFPNGADWVVGWAATARIGAITVPVNTFYQARELAQFLRHSDLQFLLGAASFRQHDYVSRLQEAAPELTGQCRGPLFLRSFPQLRRIWLSGPSVPDWADPDDLDPTRYDEDTEADPPACGAAMARLMAEDVTPADPMLISYTSGSTGAPKGVVHGHGPLIRHAFQLGAMAEIGSSSRIWTPMPLCWVGGFVFCLMRALVRGGCLVTQDFFDAGAALHLLADARVTDIAAWPGVTKALTEHPEYPSTDLGALRSGLFDALPRDARPPFPELSIGSLGMSETCGPHTFKTLAEERAGAPPNYQGTFGHPVPGVEHRIVDPDTGQDLPAGGEGEVLVRGYSLMLGLHKRERSDVFDADGWYHTGDRGYFRDGWFFFTGRHTDLIKTGGSNVAPAEIETLLIAADEVKLAYVVGVPDKIRGQSVVALVVPWSNSSAQDQPLPTSETSALADSLREQLIATLSSYKVPRHVLMLSDGQIPWLSSQKADRRGLVELAEKLLAEQSIT
jgi:acyl-CoA synthetase (AMP-forming)/AMP-acid ligase II